MLAAQGFLVVLIVFNDMISCEADRRLPAPTGLSFYWLDQLTYNVSWGQPEDLPEDCDIIYNIYNLSHENGQLKPYMQCTSLTLKEKHLMQQKSSSQLKVNITTFSKNCSGWRESEPSSITISTLKPYAELVKNFKCVIKRGGLDCSWIPVDPSQKLTLSYRNCGITQSGKLQQCDNIDSRGERWRCFLELCEDFHSTYVVVETEDKMNTFEPKLGFDLPTLVIREKGDNLELTWSPPKVGQNCTLIYNVWYKECNKTKDMATRYAGPLYIPYNKCCKYEFQYNVMTNNLCPELSSDNSPVETFEAKTPCTSTATATAIAIVIPIIFFICIMLSFYCFRRHRSIICPEIPEPSDLFKEMMSVKSAKKPVQVPLYTPVPEPCESKNITLLPKKSSFKENV